MLRALLGLLSFRAQFGRGFFGACVGSAWEPFMLSGLLEAQLGRERESFAECAATGDFEEGINAFLEKRRPKFGRT